MDARRSFKWVLSALIAFIVTMAFLVGILQGRKFADEGTISALKDVVANSTRNLSLYDVLVLQKSISPKKEISALKLTALGEIYDCPTENIAVFYENLKSIVWVPASVPAPFVGHVARPNLEGQPFINTLGFRDRRLNYSRKPRGTYRIFITGGSTAFGTGAPNDEKTIARILEKRLNTYVSSKTGLQYEVINTAYPGYSTTQEKILIAQRLLNFHPDLIIMFSGNNDVHWSVNNQDISWFWSYADRNFISMIERIYRDSGKTDFQIKIPSTREKPTCDEVADRTGSNVYEAAVNLDRNGVELMFLLQPNIFSTKKKLSQHEKTFIDDKPVSYWEECYKRIRTVVKNIPLKNFTFLDLSNSFESFRENVELFVDSYHFGGKANNALAVAMEKKIKWDALSPRLEEETLPLDDPVHIVEYGPKQAKLGESFNRQVSGNSAIWFQTTGATPNVKVAFDGRLLPTAVSGGEAVTAEIPAVLVRSSGKIEVYLVDVVSGIRSQSVYLELVE